MELSVLLDALVDHEVDDDAARSEIPCRVQDAELWFAELPAQVEQAKALCRDCPVRAACLAGASERREPHARIPTTALLDGTSTGAAPQVESYDIELAGRLTQELGN